MSEDLRERLLASYGDLGEAMVAQSVLETGGVPCRVGDLGGVPSHMFGIGGGVGRSTGLWVLEPDVERARELLASQAPEALDEQALEAEALAAGLEAAAPDQPEEPLRAGRPMVASARPPRWVAPAVVLAVVVLLALFLAR